MYGHVHMHVRIKRCASRGDVLAEEDRGQALWSSQVRKHRVANVKVACSNDVGPRPREHASAGVTLDLDRIFEAELSEMIQGADGGNKPTERPLPVHLPKARIAHTLLVVVHIEGVEL